MSECFTTVEGLNYLIDGDIKWLLEQERSLERDHIEAVLKDWSKRRTGKDYDEHVQEDNKQ